jgi:hypothetical protein
MTEQQISEKESLTLKSRIRKLMWDSHFYNLTRFTKEIGVDYGGFSDALRKNNKLGVQHIRKIKEWNPNVSLDWLILGDGPPYIPYDRKELMEQNNRMRRTIELWINRGIV